MSSHLRQVLFSRTAFFKRYPRVHLPVHAAVVTVCFGLALPVAIAIFPQYSKVPVTYFITYSSFNGKEDCLQFRSTGKRDIEHLFIVIYNVINAIIFFKLYSVNHLLI